MIRDLHFGVAVAKLHGMESLTYGGAERGKIP